MRAKRYQSGQTLVETALVLPLLGLFVFGVVWLIALGHNEILLQKLALDQARIVAADPYAVLMVTPSEVDPLWQKTTWPLPHRSTTPPPVWRAFIPTIFPFPGVPTVQKAPGALIHVRCDSLQQGVGHWTSLFRPINVWAAAESPVEGQLPPNS